MNFYHYFETPSGWMACLMSPGGLKKLTLPHESIAAAMEALGDIGKAIINPRKSLAITREIQAYFQGHRPRFNTQLDISDGTLFRRNIWQAIRSIPYGETRSYGWVACTAGYPGAARAAGQATGENPIAIIVPCHRVINSDGTIGGFGKGWQAVDLKRHLLAIEGVFPA